MRNQFRKLSLFLTLSGLLSGQFLYGQEIPSVPLSIPVYHPMVLNPAYVGSKDFTNIGLTTKASKYPNNQILSFHKRIKGKDGQYSNFGLGSYLFHEQKDQSWNGGIAISGAYHYAVDKDHLHNISFGVTAKGIAIVPKNDAESIPDSAGTVFHPDMDLGLYYYGPHAFGGVSVTSLFASEEDGDSTMLYSKINRGYNLFGGYKFMISEELGIVIEPSLLLTLNNQTISEPHKHVIPYLKVYLQNFYIGTYLKDFDIFALFFQYQFPKFYTGIFLEFPRVGYLNDDNIIFEVSIGLNLGKSSSTFSQYRHW